MGPFVKGPFGWPVIPGGMREWLIRQLNKRAESGGTFTLPADMERGEDFRITRRAPSEDELVNDDGTKHRPGRPQTHL